LISNPSWCGDDAAISIVDQPRRGVLNKSKIIAFAATTGPATAKKFYHQTLGLELVEDNPFALVFDANGTMLRVQKVQKLTPAPHTVLGWQVPDIHDTIKGLIACGVLPERYEALPQDDLGVWKSPSGAQIAWFKDP